MALTGEFFKSLPGRLASFFCAEGRTGNGCGLLGCHHTSAQPSTISKTKRKGQADVAGSSLLSTLGGLVTRAVCIGIAGIAMSGCAHHNAGIRVYEPAVSRGADGSERAVSRLVASVSGDMPGLEELRVGAVSMRFGPGDGAVFEEPIVSKDGQILAVRRIPSRHGFFTSRTIAAQGRANREAIDGIAAGVTGAVLSVGGSVATSGAASALGGLVP